MKKKFEDMSKEELVEYLKRLHESAVNSEDAGDFNQYCIEDLGERLEE